VLAGPRRGGADARLVEAEFAAIRVLLDGPVDDGHLAAVLARTLSALEEGVMKIERKVEDQVMFDAVDEEKVLTSVQTLTPIIAVIKRVFVLNFGIAGAFFTESLEPKLIEWLQVPSLRFFAVWLWGVYFAATGDLAKVGQLRPFIEMVVRSPLEVDMKEEVFTMLGRVFKRHRLDADQAISYFEFFVNAFAADDRVDERGGLAWDAALIAFSHLVRMNIQFLDQIIAAEKWHEFMPLWYKQQLSEGPAALLADFLESRNPVIVERETLEVVLMRLFREKMIRYMKNETWGRIVAALRALAIESPDAFIGFWEEPLFSDEREVFVDLLEGTGVALREDVETRTDMSCDMTFVDKESET
jgi:hypothetical protein